MSEGKWGIGHVCTPPGVVQPCMQTPLSPSSPLHGRLDPHTIILLCVIRRHVDERSVGLVTDPLQW